LADAAGGASPLLRIATRGSPLARWQAAHVASLLGGSAELVVVDTSADRRAATPIWELGGKGAFVTEVQAAVLDGRAELAVHSAKDLPAVTVAGLVLAAVPERGEARDALVGGRLDELRPGARIGTGSVRRRAQLAAYRPDLTFAGLRGNMHTRLARAADHDAVVVAAVAFQRIGLGEHLSELLPTWLMLPQVGQGALAVECRVDDDATRQRLSQIEHGPSRARIDAERAFLAELGGDCDVPAGAHARIVREEQDAEMEIELEALLASLDGHVVLRHRSTGHDPSTLGRSVARHLMDRAGGQALLLAG
jgi:hydroxymethylbilane synthase